MPQSLLHVLNIGTLATWLSVVGFGTLGVVVPPWQAAHLEPAAEEMLLQIEDFTLGDTQSAAAAEVAESVFSEITGSLPAPPELAPLPDIPDLPELPLRMARTAIATEPRPQVRGIVSGGERSRKSNSSTVSSLQSGGNTRSSAATSNAARIASGTMPPPTYPAEAIRRQQSGVVLVTFTIGTNGRVISAYASKPCPHPLLNNAALAAARKATFPPGPVYTPPPKPYHFQLR
ncbi:MAG: TonB family protein [Luteolibacter sp.]|jgi:protein TonB|nr:TonB family protein [Luteolibacter sp.]